MSNTNDQDDGSSTEDYSNFPIPRVSKISNPQPAIQPVFDKPHDVFNPTLFQLFFSLVNFHLPAYDLSQIDQYSPALDTLGNAFEQEFQGAPVLQEHLIRTFLVECNSQMLKLSSSPSLQKLEMLHNELFLTSEFLRLHKTETSSIEYCEMLMAETYDMFNSFFAKTVNEQFWNNGKTVDQLISELLSPEIEHIRMLNNNSFMALSKCVIRRSLDNAGSQNGEKIIEWAKKNEIPYQE